MVDKLKLKNILVKCMIGCLVFAAAIAVLAILVGGFNEATGRSLGTVFAAIIHLGIIASLVSKDIEKDGQKIRSIGALVNCASAITVLSFFTVIFATWDMLAGDIAMRMCGSFAIILFTLFQVISLIKVAATYGKMKLITTINMVIAAMIAIMIIVPIYFSNYIELDGFYWRLLAALVIIDFTMSIVAVTLCNSYVQRNKLGDQKNSQTQKTTG